MTKERFEELALIMAKVEFNTDWECDDWETQSEKWKNDYANGRRAALAAVYPLIRDEVIEECAVHVDALQNHASAGYTAKDTAYSRGCLNTAALISEIIRALKSKDTKL